MSNNLHRTQQIPLHTGKSAVKLKIRSLILSAKESERDEMCVTQHQVNNSAFYRFHRENVPKLNTN